jgi:uracil-DNA glycosylase
MRVSEIIKCADFPCDDIHTKGFLTPSADIDPVKIMMLMISEVPPPDPKDDFYAPGDPFYMQTTRQAFGDAGVNVSSMDEILDLGVYITTAVKCSKKDLSISSQTINNCSALLEKEIGLFPNIKAVILNGDTAIKSYNRIAKKRTGKRVIPAGSTYKIRKEPYFDGGIRVFPSYILTGKNFLIEKSKRRMISEDIREAMKRL